MFTTFINIFIALVLITIASLTKEIVSWICDTMEKVNLPEKVSLVLTVLIILLVASVYLTLAYEFITQ